MDEKTVLARFAKSEDDYAGMMTAYRALGIASEQQGNYTAASAYYDKGLKAYERSKRPDTSNAYFLHNNAGYCLNKLGKHKEAEKLCRKALAIDPSRPNAYKNLGLSLEGQRHYKAAAESYLTGTKVFPGDNRSLIHLHRLLSEKPEIFE